MSLRSAALAARPTVDADDESGLTHADFMRLADFIYDYSGIKMPSSKKTMLEGRLRKRMRATGYASFSGYCGYLFEQDGLEDEAVQLIDVVTTNKTDFFREPRHFDYLTQVVLPAFTAGGGRRMRLWSSACSTGAEPYTLAMLMEDFSTRQATLNYSILATDLSTEVLQTAAAGIYARDLVDPVPADLRRRYVMEPLDRRRGEVRIHPSLRARVGFARMNLMDDRYHVGEPMDAIFCRNVLIYFDKATQAAVLRRLCDCLASGGHLFIGHSESILGADLPVTQVANTVFRKI
jgi:chemotaxis protein methyltransferase CheR